MIDNKDFDLPWLGRNSRSSRVAIEKTMTKDKKADKKAVKATVSWF